MGGCWGQAPPRQGGLDRTEESAAGPLSLCPGGFAGVPRGICLVTIAVKAPKLPGWWNLCRGSCCFFRARLPWS